MWFVLRVWSLVAEWVSRLIRVCGCSLVFRFWKLWVFGIFRVSRFGILTWCLWFVVVGDGFGYNVILYGFLVGFCLSVFGVYR